MNHAALISEIQKSLSPDLLKGRWKYHQTHPLSGHCYVASEALWHLIDDKSTWAVMCASYNDANGKATHWWLKNKNTKEILDPTAAQFQVSPPYHLGKGCGFLTKLPSKRAQTLIDRVVARTEYTP